MREPPPESHRHIRHGFYGNARRRIFHHHTFLYHRSERHDGSDGRESARQRYSQRLDSQHRPTRARTGSRRRNRRDAATLRSPAAHSRHRRPDELAARQYPHRRNPALHLAFGKRRHSRLRRFQPRLGRTHNKGKTYRRQLYQTAPARRQDAAAGQHPPDCPGRTCESPRWHRRRNAARHHGRRRRGARRHVEQPRHSLRHRSRPRPLPHPDDPPAERSARHRRFGHTLGPRTRPLRHLHSSRGRYNAPQCSSERTATERYKPSGQSGRR